MYTLSAESTANPSGPTMVELVAGPGVAGPTAPLPANTDNVPPGVTLST